MGETAKAAASAEPLDAADAVDAAPWELEAPASVATAGCVAAWAS